ncbi:MAG: hypothetical protein IPL33_05885 [Sphingobacteriales bacterium]|nr:hypothetical protein [Sphingobacteriales bacterium]
MAVPTVSEATANNNSAIWKMLVMSWQTALNKGYNQAQAAIKEYCRTAQ